MRVSARHLARTLGCVFFFALAFALFLQNGIYGSVALLLQQGDQPAPAAPSGAVVLTDTVFLPLVETVTGYLDVQAQPDAGRAVSKVVPPGGGSVMATSAAGDSFTFIIPDGALLLTTTITLTPVTSLAGAPYSLAAAVQIGPEMLGLHKVATLRIAPKPAVPVDQEVTFAWFDRGHDFHLYPVSLDITKLEYAVVRLHSYGVGRAPDASAADGMGAAADLPPGWTPAEELARIMQEMSQLNTRERQRQYLGEDSDLTYSERALALLGRYYNLMLKPHLAAMEEDCVVYEARNPRLMMWEHTVTVLDGVDQFRATFDAIHVTRREGLANCYREVSLPCMDWSDLIQEALVYSYYRELTLNGWQEDVPSPQELPVCETIDVRLSGGIFDHTMQPDPETGWVRSFRYHFPDDSVSSVGFYFPPGMGQYASARMRVNDKWVELPAFPSRNFYCRDRAAERMSDFYVTVFVPQNVSVGIRPRVIADNIGCWRWMGSHSMHQTIDEYYESGGTTRNTDIDSSDVVFERPSTNANWNYQWHQFNATTGALEVAPLIYEPVPSQGYLNFTYHWHAITREQGQWCTVNSQATNVLVTGPFDVGSDLWIPNAVPRSMSHYYRTVRGSSVMMDVPMTDSIQNTGAGSCNPPQRSVMYYTLSITGGPPLPTIDATGKSSEGERIVDGRADQIKDYTVYNWSLTALREVQ